MKKKCKEILYTVVTYILPDKMMDFFWGKYYIWTVRRKGDRVSLSSYYVKNPNKTKANYCIFRFSLGQGIFAIANKMLFYSDWAIKNNLIPLIDFEREEDFLEQNFDTELNVWNYCFSNRENFETAFQKGNVLVMNINGGQTSRKTCVETNGNPDDYYVHSKKTEYQLYYKKLNQLSQSIWLFKPEIKTKIDRTLKDLFSPQMRVIGVVLREEFGMNEAEMTDFQKKLYANHPRALSLEETCQILENRMKDWQATHILVSTMFGESIDFFKERFGEKVIFVNRKRRSYSSFVKSNAIITEEAVLNGSKDYEQKLKKIGISKEIKEQETVEYVIEMAAIAHCDYCMGVKCSGMLAACIINGGKFEDIYFFEDKNGVERY